MKNKIIIDKPERQQRSQRIVQVILTAGFWFLFLSLLRPLLALAGWLVGFHLFTHEMIDNNGGQALLKALRDYGLVVLLLALMLRSWAYYNQQRFKGRNQRRKPVQPMPREIIAQYHQVDPTALSLWQKSRWLYMQHNAEGRILEVQTEPQLTALFPGHPTMVTNPKSPFPRIDT
jgi:poly-beta-1,6-N-acetyl-D-glucosamine biosynthesis protein PgaD